MARHKRFDEKLRQAQEKFGDVLISEALDRLRNPRLGRPPRWGVLSLAGILLCVEAIKAKGRGTAAACEAAAKFYGDTTNTVEKCYGKARKHFGPLLLQLDMHEVLRRYQEDAGPALKKFLQEIKPTAKKRRIR